MVSKGIYYTNVTNTPTETYKIPTSNCYFVFILSNSSRVIVTWLISWSDIPISKTSALLQYVVIGVNYILIYEDPSYFGFLPRRLGNVL